MSTASLNEWRGMGNTVANAELKKTDNGVPYVQFTLACDRPFKNGNNETETDFIFCIIWRDLATALWKYLKKGRHVFVGGRLQVRSYDDEGGIKRYITEVVADTIKLLDPPPEDNDRSNNANSSNANGNNQNNNGNSNANSSTTSGYQRNTNTNSGANSNGNNSSNGGGYKKKYYNNNTNSNSGGSSGNSSNGNNNGGYQKKPYNNNRSNQGQNNNNQSQNNHAPAPWA